MRESSEVYSRVRWAIWENTVTVETDSETWSREIESGNSDFIWSCTNLRMLDAFQKHKGVHIFETYLLEDLGFTGENCLGLLKFFLVFQLLSSATVDLMLAYWWRNCSQLPGETVRSSLFVAWTRVLVYCLYFSRVKIYYHCMMLIKFFGMSSKRVSWDYIFIISLQVFGNILWENLGRGI